jgi:GMP synthase-like glutamine amidotransferase
VPTVACLHHLRRPFTGYAGAALRGAGLALDERDLRRGDALPALDEVDAILTLGGEQSVREIDRYPYLRSEAELLRAAVQEGKPVLGVCLGGQLLAHALGGEVRRMRRRMVTWAPVEPLAPAAGDPLLGSLPPGAHALHWNEDCFTVPAGAVELLARVGPGVEAFRAGTSAWGIQFHPEVDPPTLDGWYADGPHHLDEAGVSVDAARAADAHNMPGQAKLARALFGGFARVVIEAAGEHAGQPAASARAPR